MALLSQLPAEFLKTLKPIEIKVIQARSNYLSFSQLKNDQRTAVVTDAIQLGISTFQTNLIPNEPYLKTTSQAFEKFLIHMGYGNYTEAEFALAMFINRISKKEFPNGIEIETQIFKGNIFGLDFFASLLLNYKAIRDLLDAKFLNFLDGASEGAWLN